MKGKGETPSRKVFLLYNPDFKDQYVNFFAAYGMGGVGYKLIIRYGIEPLAIFFIVFSLICFVYVFKTTLSRLIDRIKQGRITVSEGVEQYLKSMFICVLMGASLPVVVYLGEKFWKLHLF